MGSRQVRPAHGGEYPVSGLLDRRQPGDDAGKAERHILTEAGAKAIASFLDPIREPGKKSNGEYDEFDWAQAWAVVDAILPLLLTSCAASELAPNPAMPHTDPV